MATVGQKPMYSLDDTTVSVTAASQTLAALLATAGSSLDDRLRQITILTTAGGIYYRRGAAASAATWPLAANQMVVIPCAPKDAATIQFIAPGGATDMLVWQEGGV